MKTTTLVLPPLAVLTLLTSMSSADPSRTVEFEIVDAPRSGPAHLSRYAVSVVDDRGWFSADTRDGAAALHLGARVDHDPHDGPRLTIQVRRHGAQDLDVQAGGALGPTRTLMGKVEREDGRSEVWVVVK